MKKILAFILLASLFFFKPQTTHAEVIHSFETQVTAHKNGIMDVNENINYDFESLDRHGIYRYIPLFSKVGDLYRIIKIDNVKVLRDGKSEKFSVSQDTQNITFKIGNPDHAITGDHTYQISYSVENGIGSNFSDHDEVYWNATGNGWDVTIEKANAKVVTDFPIKLTNFLCFEGALGAKDKSCKVNGNSASSFQTLYSGYGLTVVAVYPVNTFPKSFLSKTPPQTITEQIFKYYYLIFIFLNLVLPILIFIWYEKHKNKKRFGPPSVNFDIPKDENGKRIAPALAGTIDTAQLIRDDVTATIFDLAIRKFIKLSQTRTVKTLRPDKTDQVITKLKESDGTFDDFEQTLFDRLFETGDTVKASELSLDFYITFGSMKSEVFSTLIKKGYYTKNPAVQRSLLVVAAFFALFTLNIILALAFFVLAKKLNGRTSLGDEIDYKIDGLKLFLKNMDRNYKWQAQNFYTVEQMIPYAMALGYIDRFMEALKILKPDYNPSWYSGGNFYVNYAIFSAATSSNLTTSAPSSSSGGGGGGFSGGGGGGGGGGSW